MSIPAASTGLVEAEAEVEAGQPRRRGYAAYVGLKVLGSIGSFFFMLVVNFFLFRVLPGDPARTLGRGRLSTPGTGRGVQQDLRSRRVDPDGSS